MTETTTNPPSQDHQQNSTVKERMDERKSRVRVRVTYAAMSFLFLGGPLFIVFLIWTGKLTEALGLFQALLPVATAIVSFWFAGRGSNKK